MPVSASVLYTPRDEEELEVCYSLFSESYRFACKFADHAWNNWRFPHQGRDMDWSATESRATEDAGLRGKRGRRFRPEGRRGHSPIRLNVTLGSRQSFEPRENSPFE